MVIRHAEEGKFAILTTRFPGSEENNRRIIGAFQIGTIVPATANNDTVLIATPTGRIELYQDESLYFWQFYSNRRGGNPAWKTKLFRYLEDEQVHQILLGMAAVVQEDRARATIVRDLIHKNFS